MIRLLNAGFTRIRKNKYFCLLIVFSIVFSFLVLFCQYNNMQKYEQLIKLEEIVFNFPTIIGIVSAIFISLFLGVEYSDGGLRNKICIGHSRINIYISNLLIVSFAAITAFLIFLIVTLSIGIPLFGGLTITLPLFILKLFVIFMIIIVYCAIFTFIIMLISSKTISSVVNIMLAFLLIITAICCLNILNTPQEIQVASIDNSTTKEYEITTERNPKYPSEIKKKICQKIIEINPAGQAYLIMNLNTNFYLLILYSLGVFIIFTGAGLIIFQKKELK